MLKVALGSVTTTGVDCRTSVGAGEDFLKELVEEDDDFKWSYGSVYGDGRVWASKDQFQLAVLGAAAGLFPSKQLLDLIQELRDDVTSAMLEALGEAESQPAVKAIGYQQVLAHTEKLVRFLATQPATVVTGDVSADQPVRNGGSMQHPPTTMFSIWIAIWGCALSTPDPTDDEAVAAPIRQGLETLADLLSDTYVRVLEPLGFRLRTDRSTDAQYLFARALMSLLFGSALQVAFTEEVEDQTERNARREILPVLEHTTDALIRAFFDTDGET